MAGKKGGAFGMPPTDRYVYIDGTKDVWDREKKRRIAEGAVKMALGDTYPLWLNSSERRTVDVEHIVFDPTMSKDPAVYINTFDGLPLEPVRDDAACANLRWLISFLCNHDEAAHQWLTRWLAYPLQHLGAKMDTAVLMHSIMEGSGKSLLFADALGMLYGQYAATVGQTQLESNFNAWQSRKLWSVFEEVASRDQRYNQSRSAIQPGGQDQAPDHRQDGADGVEVHQRLGGSQPYERGVPEQRNFAVADQRQ
ncbi:hypothetical protein D3C84_637040 [compost metagenome]